MSKKLYAVLLPVLAIAAMAMSAGAAQAAPHWYLWKCVNVGAGKGAFNDANCSELGGVKEFEWKWERLPFTGAKTRVSTFGTLTLSVPGVIEVTCQVSDSGFIWNPVGEGAGKDEITAFRNEECVSSPACTSGITVTAEGLPWATELSAGPPIRDKIKGIKIKVVCTSLGVSETFKGELTPKVVNPGRFEFGEGSGELEGEGAGKPKAKVTGTDFGYSTTGGNAVGAFNP